MGFDHWLTGRMLIAIASMGLVYLPIFMVNVGKYTIHGWYWDMERLRWVTSHGCIWHGWCFFVSLVGPWFAYTFPKCAECDWIIYLRLPYEFKPNVGKYVHGSICAMVKSRYIGDGHPTFNRNPYNGYITPTIGLMTIPYYMELLGV